MPAERSRVRLQLDEDEARAVFAGLQEALAADLLAVPYRDAVQTVLDRLGERVPVWLDRSPVRGEAGYLIAAEAVLHVLVSAENRGRSGLADTELAHALAADKPAGVTIDAVLVRMRRERLLRSGRSAGQTETWWSAAPAGRRLLSGREGTGLTDEWRVGDAGGLAELIFREHRPGREAHRLLVQAIGRLSDERFETLAGELRAAELLAAPGEDANWLELTTEGDNLAMERVRATLPPQLFVWELPAPPLPFVRSLPLRVPPAERRCRCGSHAAWLAPSSKTKLHQALVHAGSAEWECRWCGRRWLVVLLPHLRDGTPAFERPTDGVFVRPIWRLR